MSNDNGRLKLTLFNIETVSEIERILVYDDERHVGEMTREEGDNWLGMSPSLNPRLILLGEGGYTTYKFKDLFTNDADSNTNICIINAPKQVMACVLDYTIEGDNCSFMLKDSRKYSLSHNMDNLDKLSIGIDPQMNQFYLGFQFDDFTKARLENIEFTIHCYDYITEVNHKII